VTRRLPTRAEVALFQAGVTIFTFVVTMAAIATIAVHPDKVLEVLPILVVAYGVTAITYSYARNTTGSQQPIPRRIMAPADLAKAHDAVRRRFATLRAEYAAYESDAIQVLRLPALADVSVPSTARFIDDLTAALVLDTNPPKSSADLARFRTAVDRACRSWDAAREAARRIRDTTLAPGEHATIRRVLKLLDHAANNDNDAERRLAYTRAHDQLTTLTSSGAINVPPAAMTALSARAQGEQP
jgi:hypothetical protein